MLKVSINGKLYLAGEYNIISSGHKAILIPSNKTIDFYISENQQFIIKQNKYVANFELDKNMNINGLDKNHLYVKGALEIVFRYLKEKMIPIKPLNIELDNKLVDKTKYGLGSSSAIFVGVIKAVLLYHSIIVPNETLFKLAVLAQYNVNELSSGGDIALCVLGKTTFYQSYDFDWFLGQDKTNILNIINLKWPNLQIEKLEVTNAHIYVGYSGVSYKTKGSYLKYVANHFSYNDFSTKAEKVVINLKDAIINKDKKLIERTIYDYHLVLKELNDSLETKFITNDLEEVLKNTQMIHLGSKISGAGFGDSMICFTFEESKELEKLWKELKIKVIDKIII